MKRSRISVGVALAVSSALVGCGDSPQSPRQDVRTLGGVKEGAPLAITATDLGILQDPAGYKPAEVPGRMGTGGAGDRGGGVAADADSQVRVLVTDFRNALRDMDFEIAMRFFDAEQIAPLLEDYEFLYPTLERLDRARRSIEAKLGAAAATRMADGVLGAGGVDPAWKLLDAEHASVTPNLARVLFGSVRPGNEMALALKGGSWRIQINPSLSAEDVESLRSFHEKLGSTLDALVDWLESQEAPNEAVFEEAFNKALRGEEVDVQNLGTPPADEQKPEEPEGEEPAGRGRGRARPVGGG